MKADHQHDNPVDASTESPGKVRPGKRVTIQDVAKHLGVAPSTVSNALSGRRFVEAKLKRRVLAAAKELGYRPSGIARALRLQRSSTVALMIADISSTTSAESVLGIEDELLPEEYQLIICNTGYAIERETKHIDLLIENRVDGVIIMSSSLHDQNITRLQREGIRTVLLSRRNADLTTDFVGVNNEVGLAEATNHLLQLGHTRLVFLGGAATESSVAAEKIAAFRKVLAASSLEPAAVIATDFGFDDAYRVASDLFQDRTASAPTAIIAVNDITALGVIEAAFDAKLRVPHDVSVVGWDDGLLASLRSVQLTTVRQPLREMGKAAASLLLEQMRSEREEVKELIFLPTLMIRGTTAAPVDAAGYFNL
jgi:LacI family transcriptional regulator